MKASRVKIAGAIADRTLAEGVTQEYAREIAAYLLSEGRVDELESILRDVQADWAAKGFVEVIARSVHPISDTVRSDIVMRVKPLFPEAEKVAITEIIDPSVIGGVQIQLADRQLDLSVEAKLNTFKQLTGAGKE
jgi:F0F1-type ATP synthase delta subunit